MNTEIHDAHSLADTARIAASVASRIEPGAVVTLEGDLGAGKTTFVSALVSAMGGETNAVSSPTFMLLNLYDTPRMKVFHLDAYRVGGSDDFEAIGFGELLEQNGVVLVEWASRVSDLLPANRISIAIITLSETSRRFTIEWP